MRYLIKTSNYLEKIALSNSTHRMRTIDLVIIGVEKLRISSGCSLDKEFINLICMNPKIVLYLSVNHADSWHSCVCGLLN